MSSRLLALVLVSSAFLAAESRAGVQPTVYGTGAVVCRTANGAVGQAEVLDLYEASELNGIQIINVVDVPTARTAMMTDLVQRYGAVNTFPNYFASTIAAIHPEFQRLADGVTLGLAPDVYPTVIPAGCRIEQLSAVQANGMILLDPAIFSVLSPLGRFAVELHETIAALDRKWTKSTDSRFARKVVGFLLARSWGTGLDTAINAYGLNYPRGGRYADASDLCNIVITDGNDGTIRITPDLSCRTTINWDAFGQSSSAILAPTAQPGFWAWGIRGAPAPSLLVKRVDAATLTIGNSAFHWTAN
jgi:hypothetical protein